MVGRSIMLVQQRGTVLSSDNVKGGPPSLQDRALVALRQFFQLFPNWGFPISSHIGTAGLPDAKRVGGIKHHRCTSDGPTVSGVGCGVGFMKVAWQEQKLQ